MSACGSWSILNVISCLEEDGPGAPGPGSARAQNFGRGSAALRFLVQAGPGAQGVDPLQPPGGSYSWGPVVHHVLLPNPPAPPPTTAPFVAGRPCYTPGNYTYAQRSAANHCTGPVDQSLHIPAAQLIHVIFAASFPVESFLPKDTPLAGCHGFEEHWALCTETPCSDFAQRIDCAWGAWGQWESFGGCSGLGVRSRKIFRMNSEGGAPCSGVKEETMQMDKYFDSDCLMGNRDCEWSPWTDWSHCGCDVCGEDRKAQTVRVRHIANQALGTGKACAGKFNMTKTCGFEMPVQCSLSEWGQWTRCSATCGGGVRASLPRAEPSTKVTWKYTQNAVILLRLSNTVRFIYSGVYEV
ncbi:SPON1 [Symbiodinium sp. CCMP2456]|nr:SPON1 [Symbiodinium sp. CCMP2456]